MFLGYLPILLKRPHRIGIARKRVHIQGGVWICEDIVRLIIVAEVGDVNVQIGLDLLIVQMSDQEKQAQVREVPEDAVVLGAGFSVGADFPLVRELRLGIISHAMISVSPSAGS